MESVVMPRQTFPSKVATIVAAIISVVIGATDSQSEDYSIYQDRVVVGQVFSAAEIQMTMILHYLYFIRLRTLIN
jgi:hypothetical protein